MHFLRSIGRNLSRFGLLALIALMPVVSFAHCDGLDGPVVKAARQALAKGDVNLVLIWIQPGDEAELRRAFEHTMAVRKLSPEAEKLADHHFFETLVRIHRAGEGVAFTGLKPAGRDLGPAIPLAERAIESGSAEAPVRVLTSAVAEGLQERFKQVQSTKGFKSDDTRAGREYVKAYVGFLHYVEGLHEAVQAAGHEHTAPGKTVEHEHEH